MAAAAAASLTGEPKLLKDYLDGIRGYRSVINLSDLDDKFVSKILSSFPTVSTSSPLPSSDGRKGIKNALVETFNLPYSFASNFVDSSNMDMGEPTSLFIEEVKALNEITELLVSSAFDRASVQHTDANTIMNKIWGRNFSDNCLSSLEILFKADSNGLVEQVTAAFLSVLSDCIRFKQPSAVFIEKTINVLEASLVSHCYIQELECTLYPLLDSSHLKSDKSSLMAASSFQLVVDFIGKMPQSGTKSTLGFLAACYHGTALDIKDDYCTSDLFSKLASDAIADGGLYSLCTDRIPSKVIFGSLIVFLELFDVSNLSDFDQLTILFANVLDGDKDLLSLFYEEKALTGPFLDECFKRFPANYEKFVPLLRVLASSQEGAVELSDIMNSLFIFTLSDIPDSSIIQVTGDRSEAETKFMVTANFQTVLGGVELIIPKGTHCKISGRQLYRWEMQFNCWDYLARLFSSMKSCEILALFVNAYKSAPFLLEDLEPFLQRVNPLYFDSKGLSMFERVAALAGCDISLKLWPAIFDFLSICKTLNADGDIKHLLLVAAQFIDQIRFESPSFQGKLELLQALTRFLNAKGTDLSEDLAESFYSALENASERAMRSVFLSDTHKTRLLVALCSLQGKCNPELIKFYMLKIVNPRNSALGSQLELLTLDSSCSNLKGMLDFFNTRLEGSLSESVLDSVLLQVSFKPDKYCKLINFVSSWPTASHYPLPLTPKSVTLLSSMVTEISDTDLVLSFVVSISHENINLLRELMKNQALKDKLVKHCSGSGLAMFIHYCQAHLDASSKFLEMVKCFPGSLEKAYELLMIPLKDLQSSSEHELYESLLSVVAVLLFQDPQSFSHAALLKLLEKDLCLVFPAVLSGKISPLNFGEFVALLGVCPAASSFLPKLYVSLVESLSDKTASFSLGPLTKIAEAIQLHQLQNRSVIQIIALLYEHLERLLMSCTQPLDEQYAGIWSNFLLLTVDVAIPESSKLTVFAGINSLVRKIFEHVSKDIDERLPRYLLLISRLLSSGASRGRLVINLCQFYHLNRKITEWLFQAAYKSLLPSFLLFEPFVEVFAETDGIERLMASLTKDPHDKHVWTALVLISGHSRFAPYVLSELHVCLDAENVEHLLNLLFVVMESFQRVGDPTQFRTDKFHDMVSGILNNPALSKHEDTAIRLLSDLLMTLESTSLDSHKQLHSQLKATPRTNRKKEETTLSIAFDELLHLQ